MIDYVDAELFDVDSLDKQIHIAISGTQTVLGNEDIMSESFQLIESLCSEEYLKFGAVEPRCVKFTVKYSAPKLLNKWLTITMTLQGSNTPFSFGDYQVTSDKPSSDRTTRSVVAYSHYHKILKNTYKSWYNSIWTNGNTMTIKQFRDKFFERLLQTHSWVVQETTTLPNDNVTIRKSKKIHRISGKDILNAICEINGVFGYPARDGVFRYIRLDNSNTGTSIPNSLLISTEYEDYETTTIDRVEILSQNGGLLAYAGESASDSENKYTIENNFLLKGLGNGANGKETAEVLAANLLRVLDQINYVPFSAEIKGNPCFEIGDRISFQSHGTTVTTFITERTLSGTQSLHDEYSAEAGDAVYPEIMNPTQSKFKEIKNEVGNIADASTGEYEVPSIDDAVNDGDLYFNFGTHHFYTPLYEIVHPDGKDGWVDSTFISSGTRITFTRPGDYATLEEFEWGEGEAGYHAYITGSIYPNITSNESPNIAANGHYGEPLLALHGITAGTYKISCKAQWECTHPYDPTDPQYAGLAYAPGFTAWTDSRTIEGGVPTTPIRFDSTTHASGYTYYEFQQTVTQSQADKQLYMWIDWWWPIYPSEMNPKKAELTIFIKDILIEKIIDVQTGETDGGLEETTEDYVGDTYVNVQKPAVQTRSRAVGDSEGEVTNNWYQIEYIRKADTSNKSGLTYSGAKVLSTKTDVMRALVKADPPQASQGTNRFCVRYTGSPDPNISIEAFGGNEWTNKTLKQYEDGSFRIVCGGTKTSGTVSYFAYKITGLTVGYSYYFNFAADFGKNAQFGNDTTKSLGVIFNTTGTIVSDDYSGEPRTFNRTTLYESFYRSNNKHYYAFNFEATETTMYMCVVLGDLLACTTQLTFTEFVIANSERKYIRKFYLYDTVQHGWLEYRPFGSTDDGGSVVPDSLNDLSDIALSNVQNGQLLTFDSTDGLWKNANGYTLPIASANDLGGIKVGNNLSIDANGVLSASSGTTVVANPSGTGTADLTALQVGNDIYDIPSGGTNVEANPSGAATETLSKLEVDGTIYSVPSGGGGGSSSEIISITGGDNTTSRTFSFAETPKKISVTYDSADYTPWIGHWEMVWGDDIIYGVCAARANAGQLSPTFVRATISYGADGKSFTITGGNAFQAWNQSGSVRGGRMFVEY